MASLSKYRAGGWSIQWVDGGARRTLYTGKMVKRQADAVRSHVEALVTASKSRTGLPNETAAWVAGISDSWRKRLHAAGLIGEPVEAKNAQAVTLGGHTERYIAAGSCKPGTLIVWKRCQRLLLAFFGAGRELGSIGVGDAKDFRVWLLRSGNIKRDGSASGLAENTTRKMCSVASQILTDAVDRNIIQKNPFTHKDIPRTTRDETSRQRFVSREIIERVLTACPCPEWRLIVALSRYGGLRCPSETLSLRWRDIDWEQGRMTITAPKTAHHRGKGQRVIPIFPELLPHLDAAFHAAPDGAEFCIARYRGGEKNLGTQFARIIKRSGETPWPKLFHNLRASRETELVESYPIQTVCSWIGNSPVVAAKHYLTVPEEHFTRAVLQSVLRSVSETSGIGRTGADSREATDSVPA